MGMVTITSPAGPGVRVLTGAGGNPRSTPTSCPCTVWLRAERLVSLSNTVTATARLARGTAEEIARRSWKLWPGPTQDVCWVRVIRPLGEGSAPAALAPAEPIPVTAAPQIPAPARARTTAVSLATRRVMAGRRRSGPRDLAARVESRDSRRGPRP